MNLVPSAADAKTTEDPGMDGIAAADNTNANVATDVYAYGLAYYNSDYLPIGGSAAPMGALTTTNTMLNNTNSLYNGNIAFTTSYMNTGNTSFNQKIIGNLYQYDQLNRIRQANTYKYDAANGYYRGEPKDKTPFMYDNTYTYDLNGNLLTLQRYNGNAQRFDNLTYNYDNSKCLTNRLTHVNDDAANTNIMPEDIDNQAAGNYAYDALGNMIKDQQAGITTIDWTPFGKIDRITAIKNKTLGFKYDALGNRVEKFTDINGNMEKLYYLRDAQGNIMSTYKLKNGDLYLDELYVYGSNRLGSLLVNKKIEDLGGGLGNHTAGKKTYELNNHLGNVMMTISDAPKYLDSDGNGSTDATTASVSTAQDYYPFGMLMPGRNYNASAYKFGFNGKENDIEVMGITGALQDYGMRQYNSLLAQFMSVDPITKKYPELTPYQFASNRPIDGIDLDGMEHKRYDISVDKDWNVKFVTNNSHYLPSPTNADVKWGTLYVIHHPDEEITRFEESSAPMVVFRSDYPLVIGGHIFEKSENIHWTGEEAFWERGLPTLLTVWTTLATAGMYSAMGTAALFNSELWGARMIFSVGSQALINKEVDMVDVMGDAFLMPLFSNLIGASKDLSRNFS